ncbi:MAG: GntR family transcriptional regulator [Bacilli bacterium]|nr:GntR family transcriptional regulator [Bacilli bacterium]MDD4077721.1 GntR family transcriptional regulator [Bacilli bacterium]MDD4388740.1 GntR family transcriptional regulator [Bacilli bacterium]
MKIDFMNNMPLYLQLRAILKENIENGTWKEGTMIPSELELVNYYKVSRVTVRRAISKLVEEKYLVRRPGFGTVVYRNKASLSHFTQIRSFTNEMKEIGMKNKTLESRLIEIKADEELAEIFNIPVGMNLYNLKRVRGLDIPIVYSDTYLYPVTKFPNDEIFLKGSLYAFLTSHNIFFNNFEEIVSAVKAPKEVLEKLKVDKDSVQLKRVRHSYNDQNQLIEYTINYYNAEMYEYHTSILYSKK